MHGVGQLNVEQAEHGQRQHHHQGGRRQYDGRLLQPNGQQRAGQPGNHADDGISQCQALGVHHRQGEGAAFSGVFIADYDAGNNGNQRIHAGSETQSQPGSKKRQ